MITFFWAHVMFALMFVGLYTLFTTGSIHNFRLLEISSIITLLLFMLQFSISLLIDSRYESNLFRYFVSCIWYPYAFWLLNSITLVHGFPKALFRNKNRKATWVSPDRGVQ